MKNLVTLDVLVVYSASLALSAAADSDSSHPFLLNSKQANYNLSYAYFLQLCHKAGLKAGLSTSDDVTGPGQCSNYWTFAKNKWLRRNNSAWARQVFDKISPVSSAAAAGRQLLLSDQDIQPFNDLGLFDTFFDKLLTYQQFPEHALPTVEVPDNKLLSIKASLQKLQTLRAAHPCPSDFTAAVVLKDRFGAGGNFVYKISRNLATRIQRLMRQNPQVRFILQPFLSFEAGYRYKNTATATDIRLIFHHDQLLQCYVRMAKAKDFRCNEHQGGQLEYVTPKDIPPLIHSMARALVGQIAKPHSLYALDFVLSNSGNAYFIEGIPVPALTGTSAKKSMKQNQNN